MFRRRFDYLDLILFLDDVFALLLYHLKLSHNLQLFDLILALFIVLNKILLGNNVMHVEPAGSEHVADLTLVLALVDVEGELGSGETMVGVVGAGSHLLSVAHC